MVRSNFDVRISPLTLQIDAQDQLDELIKQSLTQDTLSISNDIVKRLADELASAYDSLLRDGLDITNVPAPTSQRCERIARKAIDSNLLGDPKIREAAQLLQSVVVPTLGNPIPDVAELQAMRASLGAMTDLFQALPAFDFTQLGTPKPHGPAQVAAPAAAPAPDVPQVDLSDL
jgi:hypothetical protein